MKISTKGRYGLRAMIDLAAHSNGEYISLSNIASRQNISVHYLEHAFSALKKAGIIFGLAGVNGGYRLAKAPEEITLQEILFVLEGDMSVIKNVAQGEETLLQCCIREALWDKINEKILSITQSTTLSDMIKCHHAANR